RPSREQQSTIKPAARREAAIPERAKMRTSVDTFPYALAVSRWSSKFTPSPLRVRRVQCDVFFIRRSSFCTMTWSVRETAPSLARGRAEVQGCTCQRKNKLAHPEYPQYTPMSLKNGVNFLIFFSRRKDVGYSERYFRIWS